MFGLNTYISKYAVWHPVYKSSNIINGPSTSILSITMSYPGQGYNINDTFSIDGGSSLATAIVTKVSVTGTGFTVNVTSVSSGVITGYTFGSNGTGYFDGGTFNVNGGSSLAVGNIISIDGAGAVTGFIITSPGSGYTTGIKSTTLFSSVIGKVLSASLLTNGIGYSSRNAVTTTNISGFGSFLSVNITSDSAYQNVVQSNNGIFGSPSRGTGISSVPMINGKWYWETTVLRTSTSSEHFGIISPHHLSASDVVNYYQDSILGITDSSTNPSSSIGIRNQGWAATIYYENNYLNSIGYGSHFNLGLTSTPTNYNINSGDVFGFYLDVEGRSFSVYQNGTLRFNIDAEMSSGQLGLTSSSGIWYAACASDGSSTSSSIFSTNFGRNNFSYYATNSGHNPGVFNPIYSRLDPTFANSIINILDNNLTARVLKEANASSIKILGQLGKSSGKWYWEVKCTGGSVSNAWTIGVAKSTVTGFPTLNPNSWTYNASGLRLNPTSSTGIGTTYGLNDVIGIMLDMDNGYFNVTKNGVYLGTVSTGLSGSLYPFANTFVSTSGTNDGPKYTFNFGQTPFYYKTPPGYLRGLYY